MTVIVLLIGVRFTMSARAVEAFLASPYAKVVDAKMWLFFAEPTRFTIAVLGILVVRPPKPLGRRVWLRPVTAAAFAVGLYLVVIVGFQAAGHWHTAITEEEYHRRLQELDSPLYTHVGGTAMTEEISDP